MMGFGSYGNGGGSSPSPSNLSALAPPFTVDRSVSKPLVDLTEPPLNWLNTHPLSFDSVHSSQAYGYPFNPPSAAHLPPPENTVPVTSTDSFPYGQNSDAIPTTNLVEAKICYPSYDSPSKYTYDDYAQSLSGLWDGSRGWEFGKKVELGESFCSNDMNVPDLSIYNHYSDQGVHSSKSLNTCEQNTNIIDMLGGKEHRRYTNREQIDYKSFPVQISEFMPVEYSGKSVLGPTSLFPKTYSLLSCEQGLSRNHHIPYGASHEKDAKQNSISQNDISSVMMSSGLVIRSQAVGSSPSAPYTSSSNNVVTDINANNTDFSGSGNFSKMKEFQPLQGTEGHFDASQVSFPLDGGIHCVRESPLEKKEKPLSNVNVINNPLREKSGLQIPDIGPGCFSLIPASNGALNCLEGSSECLDHFCHSVDSPCWKGSSDYHFSPLENFGSVTPPHMRKIGGSNSIGSTDDAVKFSSQKPSDYSLNQENGCLENASESFPKRLSLSNLFFKEHGNDHDLKTGSYDMKSSCGHRVQISGYVDQPKRDSLLANNTLDEFKIKSFPMLQNSVEDTFDKIFESGTAADVGMSTNDASEGCSSHVPLHATKHVMSSPSSIKVAPSRLTKLQDEELAPQMCVQTLISTMHNLSELILLHCSNEVCQLKENDVEALEQVVNNLDKCISKITELEPSLQESLLVQKSTQIIREFPELHQGGTMSSPHDSTTAFSVLNQFNNQHVQEERVHHTIFDQKEKNCSDFTSRGGDAATVKDDNMTQAIKKVLSENFVEEEDDKLQILLYKNLWLEAEAALCSINCKARFDRMKFELEKCTLKAKDLSENTPELEKPSESTFSPDRNTVNKLPPEVKLDSTQDFSAQDFPVVDTSSHPGEIVARFHILKGLESNANRRTTTDIEKLSNYSTSADMAKVDKMESEAKNDQIPYISICSLPNSSSTSCAESADDVEASVMARFHILRSRIESSSCENVGDGLLSLVMGDQLHSQVADLGFAGGGKNRTEDGTLDVNTEPVLQQNTANHTEDELTVKEFHLHVEDDPMIQLSRMNSLGNQLPASSYDSSSSDWEHVLKEDLPVYNC